MPSFNSKSAETMLYYIQEKNTHYNVALGHSIYIIIILSSN